MKNSYVIILLVTILIAACKRPVEHNVSVDASKSVDQVPAHPVRVLSENGDLKVRELEGMKNSEPLSESLSIITPRPDQVAPETEPAELDLQGQSILNSNSTTGVQSVPIRAAIRLQAMEEMKHQKASAPESSE